MSMTTAKCGSQIGESADSMQPFIQPFGAWTWARGNPMSPARTSPYAWHRLERSELGSFGRRPILTISRQRDTIPLQQWMGLRCELTLYNGEQYLKPLQGDVVPRIVSVRASSEEITMSMEPPHPSFWIEASADMPDILKERCILAFQKIHARGVLHGNPQLRHMLIGGDGRVTIVNLQCGRSSIPLGSAGIGMATEIDYHKEMRKVILLLEFWGARELYEVKESDRPTNQLGRHSSTQGMRDLQVEASWVSPDDGPLKDDIVSKLSDGETWQEHCLSAIEHLPLRIVVPDQHEDDLATAIKHFLTSLEQGEDDDMTVKFPSSSDGNSKSSYDRTSEGLLPSPFSSEAFLTHSIRQSPNFLFSSDGEFGDTVQAGLAQTRTRVGDSTPRRFPDHFDTHSNLSSRGHMWHSDDSEGEEILPKKHRDSHSPTEKRIRRDNLARCFYSKLPHPELIRAGLIHADPATLVRLRKGGRRAVAYGTLKRRFGTQPDQIESVSRGTRHQEQKELQNFHATIYAGARGGTAGLRGRPNLRDDSLWADLLDFGEPRDFPDGPRILTAMELEQRQELLSLAPSDSRRKGILKRPRHKEEKSSVRSSIDRDSVAEFENLLPPRKKIRTTSFPTRAASMFREVPEGSARSSSSPSGHGHRFTPQPSPLVVSPSLRTLSFWMELLVGWSSR
ncbi:hypothetical protein CONPUDRAFT_161272 [Coniophora puteana RWD-64-598 SS2]|uniref:Uncharacterized protein n=1 Tax=Coniophora puteana (strain RWD-64-598) TaxID=741705 RepID=A0A5M3N5G3_CONPW|nr:uncharacterized protein CONPUDRAFT_161272 [Coniophora puteana RWD-64-598 SS2]EIW86546.1 hypothetical protein CONPUDRAFT_161272 [Coniophora puteana RWD-64-598 SS2]